MVCTFYLHGAKKTEAYLQGTITLSIKDSIVFILLKTLQYNSIQTSKRRSTVDTFVVSAGGLFTACLE